MTATIHWIRPWYPAGLEGHIYPDCQVLLEVVSDPVEGSGWLDPAKGGVCGVCAVRHGGLSWDAVCDTCDSSMSEEWEEDGSHYSEDDAKEWMREHRCQPIVRIISPTRKRS